MHADDRGPAPRHGIVLQHRHWLLAVPAVLILVAGVAMAVVLIGRGGSSRAATLPPLRPLQNIASMQRGYVQQARGDTVTVATATGNVDLHLGAGTRVEALTAAKPAAIVVGDYLTVGGVPNLVNAFAVKEVVLIPAAEAAAAGAGPPRSKAGFTGWEAYDDPKEAPELFGRVAAIVPGGVRLDGPAGEVTVLLDEHSVLRRLDAGGVDLLHGGDRIAFPASAGASPAALLVLTAS